MKWLREAVTDGKTNRVSSTRVVAMLAGWTLSLCTLALTVASFYKIELAAPLTVFGGALAGLASANYVTQRITARPKNDNPD
jgi:hypothetical protein